jgi:hypothetical protein
MGGDVVSVNERLAFLLGKELGLPIAELHAYTVSDAASSPKSGVISIEHAENWGPWSQFEHAPIFDRTDFAGSCRRLVCNLNSLRETMVFDIWIRNTDRHRGNILLNEKEPNRRYEAVLIDHSHAFMHSDGSRVNEFLDLSSGDTSFLRPEELSLALDIVTNACQFEDVLCRIEAVPDSRLNDLADMATMSYSGLPAGFAQSLADGLIQRRQDLRIAVASFCNSLGLP